MKEKIILIVTALILAAPVIADVPPGPGRTYAPVAMRIWIAIDVPEYRFFLDSPMDVEEIVIKKGEPTVIDGKGRDWAKRFGKLIAIPKKSLTALGEKPTVEQLKSLDELLNQKKVDGVIELKTYAFCAEVSEDEAQHFHYFNYNIFKNNDGSLGIAQSVEILVERHKTNGDKRTRGIAAFNATPFIVGGLTMVAAALIFSIWLIRRKKNNEIP